MKQKQQFLNNSLLGKLAHHSNHYDASLLFPIPRSVAREGLNLELIPNFYGFDIWNCYEVSWLNSKSKPEVRILSITISAESKNIIESKSLKLYLNSFHNEKFSSDAQIIELLQRDLEQVAEGFVSIECKTLSGYTEHRLHSFAGVNLDMLDVDVVEDVTENILLVASDEVIEQTLYSDLLKSNCPVTNQPDWGSIQISYKGKTLLHDSVLKYIISLRNRQEFHEQCVERIFVDIYRVLQPIELTVYARYTRRGGIDINPIRSTKNLKVEELSNLRQVRQ